MQLRAMQRPMGLRPPASATSRPSRLGASSVRAPLRPARLLRSVDEKQGSPSATDERPVQPEGQPAAEDVRIKKALAGLDMLLGVEEEPKSKTKDAAAAGSEGARTIAPEALAKIAEAESQRLAGGDPARAGPIK